MRNTYSSKIEMCEHIGEPLNRVGEIHALRGATHDSMTEPMTELTALYRHHKILTFTVGIEESPTGWRVRSRPDVRNFQESTVYW
jgi:hypothetical protein